MKIDYKVMIKSLLSQFYWILFMLVSHVLTSAVSMDVSSVLSDLPSGTRVGVLSAFVEEGADKRVEQVAAGGQHSLYVMGNGSLWAMGDNTFGQLGDGSNVGSAVAKKVVEEGVVFAAAGWQTSFFIKSDGSLWGMGANYLGHLGDRTTTNRNSPVKVLDSGVTRVASGGDHTLFIKDDGSLWGMGLNESGQLGPNAGFQRTSPIKIVDSGVVEVVAGGDHTLFLKADGSLWGMGGNADGQLGTGTTESHSFPELIVSSDVMDLAAGSFHSLFAKRDGSLWAMGFNITGQLGTGASGGSETEFDEGIDHAIPVCVVESGVETVAAGWMHSLFTMEDGSLWGMGYNVLGELGDATITQRVKPTRIQPSSTAQASAIARHSLFTMHDGSLWSTGANDVGQLGNGQSGGSVGTFDAGIDQSTPVKIVEGYSVTYSLVAGEGDSDNAKFFIQGNQLRTNEVFSYEVGKTYSIRVRAVNPDQVSEETVLTLSVLENSEAVADPFRYAGTVLGHGWRHLDWFGKYYPGTSSNWHYQEDLGWLYIPGEQSLGSLWILHPHLGWLWTGESLYPFSFSDQFQSWVYFDSSREGNRIYVYNFDQWLRE